MRITIRRSARFAILALVAVALAGCLGPRGRDVVRVTDRPCASGPRVLCVVAHPDDEIAFAGTLYKTTTHLDGVCDVVVITNGEGGFKYSTLSEPVYGLELTEEEIGRRELPAIRRRELIEGCRILRVHDVRFLGQRDHRYTQDVGEILGEDAEVWDVPFVLESLDCVLRRGDYDLVLTLTPTPETHGHHQAATILALEAVLALDPGERPPTLCVRTAAGDEPAPSDFSGLGGYPVTRIAESVDPFVFDRAQALGYRGRLSYRILANWAIAEHKSQGTMQLLTDGVDREHYFLFERTRPASLDELRRFFAALAEPQYPPKTYGPSAGTNTGGG